MATIGEQIKQARKLAGLTQQQLAKKLKVTQGAIFQWEQATDMQLSTATKIAKAMKLTLCELLDCTATTTPTRGEG